MKFFYKIGLLLVLIISLLYMGCSSGPDENYYKNILKINHFLDSRDFSGAIFFIDNLEDKRPLILSLKSDALSGRAGFSSDKVYKIIGDKTLSVYEKLYNLSDSSSDAQIEDIKNSISLIETEELREKAREPWKAEFKFAILNFFKVSLFLKKYLRENYPNFDFCSEESFPSFVIVEIIQGINKGSISLLNSIEKGNLSENISEFAEELRLFNLMFRNSAIPEAIENLSAIDLLKFRDFIGQNKIARDFVCY